MNARTVSGIVLGIVLWPAMASASDLVGPAGGGAARVAAGRSVRHDVSPPLRAIPPVAVREQPGRTFPLLGAPVRAQGPAAAVPQRGATPASAPGRVTALAMPSTLLNFDGISYAGSGCNCFPPDPSGAPGATQYVQTANISFQVFDKTTGNSLLGPSSLSTIWSGFGGVCETGIVGNPVLVYDHLANRWVVAVSAGGSFVDVCVAVSTTADATGSWYRYDFNVGSTNFYFFPKLAVWPDAYYLALDVYDNPVTTFQGEQPFALDRAAMLGGNPAAFVSPGLQSAAIGALLPGDLDGAILPPPGAPNPWLGVAGTSWPLYRFHPDFVTPANTTFTLAGNLSPAAWTALCPGTFDCVPQSGTSQTVDGLGDKPMFRLAYRRFADGHEALVGNRSVSSGGVAGIRWWEIANATSGTPSFAQQGTYQPDSTWRWAGSAAMDNLGDLALGFSASSATIFPEIRYAGRLAGDTAGTLAQGESTIVSGTGYTGFNRWGDYTDMTVDPVDDCTFWYTNEYYLASSATEWWTRVGTFKFPGCAPAVAVVSGTKTVTGTFAAGGSVTYTVTLSNTGNRDQADNPGHEFTDVLPAALVLVSASATSGTAVATLGTNTVTWDGGIPAGGSVTITIHATVSTNPVYAGTTISNQGTISYDPSGSGTNGSSTVTTDPTAPGGGPTAFAEAGAIPALSGVGLAILALGLAAAAVLLLRRMS